jgi:LysR family transcriptional regulator, transcriptional activator of the cysJI operon
LRIATVHSIGLHELPRNLKLFKQAYPAIEVQVEYLRSAQVYQHVAEGAADLGFVAYPTRHRGVTIESHWKDKLVLICPPNHRLASRQSVPITALSGEKFISFSFDLPTRKAIDRIFKAHAVTIRRSMEFDNIETVKRAVEIEDGISIVPLNTIEEEKRIGSLVAVEIESINTWRPIGLVQRRARRQALPTSAFVQMLKQKDAL